jgi:hypothetical protein
MVHVLIDAIWDKIRSKYYVSCMRHIAQLCRVMRPRVNGATGLWKFES